MRNVFEYFLPHPARLLDFISKLSYIMLMEHWFVWSLGDVTGQMAENQRTNIHFYAFYDSHREMSDSKREKKNFVLVAKPWEKQNMVYSVLHFMNQFITK